MAKHSLKSKSRWDNNEFRNKLANVFRNNIQDFDVDVVYWEDIELFVETVCWWQEFSWINFYQVSTDWDYMMMLSWFIVFPNWHRVEIILWELNPSYWEQCNSIDEIVDDIINVLCRLEEKQGDIDVLKNAVNFSYIN